jgi:hypothetical protein
MIFSFCFHDVCKGFPIKIHAYLPPFYTCNLQVAASIIELQEKLKMRESTNEIISKDMRRTDLGRVSNNDHNFHVVDITKYLKSSIKGLHSLNKVTIFSLASSGKGTALE